MICAAERSRPAGIPLLDHLAQLGVPLMDLTADSRSVKLGSIFVAYPGTARDGRLFIKEAISRGASAVIWEKRGFKWDEDWEVPNLGVEDLRAQVGTIAGYVHGEPSQKLWMVGVTGTNGKTSVAQWVAQALDRLGRRAAVLGTLGNGLVGERTEAKNTTPDAVVLQRSLAEYLKRGAKAVAMEVSSHGLHQGRVAGIRFDIAVFTNLTRDHLDYHGTMEAYAAAKFRLFASPGLSHAVINVDDEWGRKFAAKLRGAPIDVITYGLAAEARLRASHLEQSDAGIRFRIKGDWGSGEVAVPVLGAFNVANLLAVAATLLASGVTFDDALGAIRQLEPVPGRLERLGGGGAPIVVVDYAHTPDALEKALTALRPAIPVGGRLYCVFGCGGERDPGKRPIMGEVAARLSDHVLVTSDNPRGENPRAIIDAILAGVESCRRPGEGRDPAWIPAPGFKHSGAGSAGMTKVEAIEDRQVAIFTAIHQARAGDIILLAGKGHETYQEIAGVKHPFSDREVARAALEGSAA